MRQRKSAPSTLAKKFPIDQAIRVVPLHHPALEATTDARLTYRGGMLIHSAKVFTIFWGRSWVETTTSKGLVTAMSKFFGDLLVSPLIDQLSEYNVSGQTIGHGKFIGSKVITTNVPTGSISDSAIQKALKNWIVSKTIPANDSNTIYFIFLEAGIVSVMGGSRSCRSFCGYHNNAGNIYYAVMPFPECAGCLGGMTVLDALTATSSHELCEAITDPVPGTGWYDDTNGEIGDICAWQFKKVAGYTVQLEWSNNQNTCL